MLDEAPIGQVRCCLCLFRNDLEEGLEGAVRAFEAWCRLLLLDVVQRAGLFRQPGQATGLADVLRLNRHPGTAGSAGHARMVEAALDVLAVAGYLRHACIVLMAEILACFSFGLFAWQCCRTWLIYFGALCRKGTGGMYTATEATAEPAVLAGTASLEATAAQLANGPAHLIATSIKLIGECMRALPDILTGAHCPTLACHAICMQPGVCGLHF